MLLMLARDHRILVLDADSARELASLGVSRVAVFRDRHGIALALEGWAFDPARAARSALSILTRQAAGVRTMHQVVDVSVAADSLDEEGSHGPSGGSAEGIQEGGSR